MSAGLKPLCPHHKKDFTI